MTHKRKIVTFTEKGVKSVYDPGYPPNNEINDTYWIVETVRGDTEIVKLGEIKVPGKLVAKEMDDHHSIKGYEPYDLAESIASKMFPNEQCLIIMPKPKD